MAKVKLKTSRNRAATAGGGSQGRGGGGGGDRRAQARAEGKKRKRVGMLITLIVFFCIFIVLLSVGGVIAAGMVPNNPDQLCQMYLEKVQYSQERKDYMAIEDYIGKANRYSKVENWSISVQQNRLVA